MKSRQKTVIRLCLIPVLFIFFKYAYAWGLLQRYGDFFSVGVRYNSVFDRLVCEILSYKKIILFVLVY